MTSVPLGAGPGMPRRMRDPVPNGPWIMIRAMAAARAAPGFMIAVTSRRYVRKSYRDHGLGGGADQRGLANAGELAEEGEHGPVQAGLAGAPAHEVGDLEGEDAGEDVGGCGCCARPQWRIGENDTTCGSLSWRKENSASDWDW